MELRALTRIRVTAHGIAGRAKAASESVSVGDHWLAAVTLGWANRDSGHCVERGSPAGRLFGGDALKVAHDDTSPDSTEWARRILRVARIAAVSPCLSVSSPMARAIPRSRRSISSTASVYFTSIRLM